MGPIYWGNMVTWIAEVLKIYLWVYARGLRSNPDSVLSAVGQAVRTLKLDGELCKLRSAQKPLATNGCNLMVVTVTAVCDTSRRTGEINQPYYGRPTLQKHSV